MQRLSDFEKQLIACIPDLQKSARKLCKSKDAADDAVQEALCRALQHRDDFKGGNLVAWVWVIMRNWYYGSRRSGSAKFLVEDPDGFIASNAVSTDDIVARMEARDALRNVQELPIVFREPLLLFAVDGDTYAEIAVKCVVTEGTVKSRVNRARALLGVIP